MGIKLFIALFATVIAVSESKANIVGVDAQNFNPTPDGLDFVTVQSGRTLHSGIFNLGLFLNYSVNTLSFLSEADPGAVQNKIKLNDKLLSADLNFAIGITDWWQVGLSLPYLLKQEISNSDQVAYFATTGLTEQRLSTKLRFYNTDTSSVAGVLSFNNNNINNNPYTGKDSKPTTNLELAWSSKWGASWFGLNFGHRWRSAGQSLSSVFGFDPLPNQWIYSAAWSKSFEDLDTKLIFEIFGSTPSEQKNDTNLTNRSRSNLESLLGLKFASNDNLAFHAGVGTELLQGVGTPDYRIYAGLNWTTGPLWERSNSVSETLSSEKQKVYVLTNLRFKFDSDELTGWSMSQVQKVVTNIQGLKGLYEIVVEGHTDSIGRGDYNLKLSQRRSEAIRKILANKIPFSIANIGASGFGESKPIADNDNYQGRAMNRRVVVIAKLKQKDDLPMTK